MVRLNRTTVDRATIRWTPRVSEDRRALRRKAYGKDIVRAEYERVAQNH